jgi:hypothetical protein
LVPNSNRRNDQHLDTSQERKPYYDIRRVCLPTLRFVEAMLKLRIHSLLAGHLLIDINASSNCG